MLPECSLSQTSKSSILHFSISNRGSDIWHLLKWHSPFDAWFSEFIELTQEGRAVLYEGAMAKRGRPDEEDYLTIEPGGVAEIELDLREAFQLDSGKYRVALKPLQLLLERGSITPAPQKVPLNKAEHYKVFELHCKDIYIDIKY